MSYIKTISLAVFFLSTLILALQAPFFFHEMRSADTVYHAAKIARVQEGGLFVDPFSGTKTLYPPLFHLIGAKSASLTNLTAEEIIHVLGVFTYILLCLSLFFLGFAVFQNVAKASLFFLLFSLIAYAPATKYLLLQGPATFSHPFVFFGMGFLFFFREKEKSSLLYLGAFFLAAACQLWWFNLFFALPFFLLFLFFMRAKISKKTFAFSILFFVLPFLFTAFHLLAIKEVLPSYARANEKKNYLSFIGTFFLRGQGDYLETLAPWKWNYDPVSSPLKTSRDVVNFIFFFLFSLTSSLFMFFSSLYLFFRKKDLSRLLLALFIAAFLFSALLQLAGNSAHLYRVQLYSHTLLLLFALCALPINWNKAMPLAIVAGSFFTLWHVLHNPNTIGKKDWHSNEDKEAAHWLTSLPDAKEKRHFFTDASYRSLVTMAPFYSLVGNRQGRYYFQDPKSADAMEGAYISIHRFSEWEKAVQDYHIEYLGFNKYDPAERVLLKKYRSKGKIFFENAKWTILKIRN